MRKRGFTIAALILAPVLAFCWTNSRMLSRDIGCGAVKDPRGKEICNVISAEMEWTWLGHAVVSPGWRLSWAGLREVYCHAHIVPQDRQAIENIRLKANIDDWRLEDATGILLTLIDNLDGKSLNLENDILNPKNPSYVLSPKCGDEK